MKEAMTMSPVVAPDQRQARQEAKQEIVRLVELGATVSEAQRRSSISLHRTTVYRLLKSVEREGEHAFVERRHGHPTKLRGEVLTCVLDYCQSHMSAASREVQHLLAERFGITVSISQLNRVRAAHGLSRKDPKLRKKSRKQASPSPLDIMNRRAAYSCWRLLPRLACSPSWSRLCRLPQPHRSRHAFPWQVVPRCADAYC